MIKTSRIQNVRNNSSNGELLRALSLRDLISYGLILVEPVAALSIFGHANHTSNGHAVTTILIAMIAMIFTAISYGKMARRYPVSGSAYTYVGKGLHPYLGFIVGWSMFMDYLLFPIICTIFSSITSNHMLPFIPYTFFIFIYIILFTTINLNGIKMASEANKVILVIMSVVVFYFMSAAIRYIFLKNGFAGLFSTKPIYDPSTFSWGAIATGTALTAVTYIGFDGITTLAEEVKKSKRNVMIIAMVLTCVITGIWSAMQIYLAHLSWPDFIAQTMSLPDATAQNDALDTAILKVANRVGGALLDGSLSFVLLVGMIGSGSAGQLGASRLLYAMGRDGVIPKKIFGHLDKKHSSPNYNILIIGFLALIGSLLLNFENAAWLLNFGAFLAFMSVNVASMFEYYFKSPVKSMKGFFLHFLPSALGFIFCLMIWINLPLKTFIVGGIWVFIGLIYLAFLSKGFRHKNLNIQFN
jgi:hypothetical protein